MTDPSASGSSAVPRIWVLDLASREERALTGSGLAAARADWSPDGTRIAFDADESVYTVALDPDGTPARLERRGSWSRGTAAGCSRRHSRRCGRRRGVLDKDVADRPPLAGDETQTLDVDTGLAERLAQVGEGTGSVLEGDG
jgi:dipeptidyl aminopeptidase/acylaminoacyl peptidase